MLLDFDPHRTEFGQVWPKLIRCWPSLPPEITPNNNRGSVVRAFVEHVPDFAHTARPVIILASSFRVRFCS